jgi:hypothetical protein
MSAPPPPHYGRMLNNVLAVLIARAGGTVTVTRSEFEDRQVYGNDLHFDVADSQESVMVEIVKRS